MPKHTLFTNVTPLPSNVTREVAIAMLHNHDEMIELNPMVIEHHPIKTPRDAPADEFLDCVWQELTDKVNYLPGGLVKGKVSYKACFHDLPTGLQTHIYAPTGLDIREKWSICGTLPGEMPERRELGSNAPASGLYLKEECDMRCNRLLSSFVRKNLDEAHKVLVERIMKKASLLEQHRSGSSPQQTKRSDTFSPTNFYSTGFSQNSQTTTSTPSGFQPGSVMSQSKILQSPNLQTQVQSPTSYTNTPHTHRPQQSYPPPNLADHPAFRNDQASRYASATQDPYAHTRSASTNGTTSHSYSTSTSTHTNSASLDSSSTAPAPLAPRQVKQQFLAELPGSDPTPSPAPSSNKDHPYATRYGAESISTNSSDAGGNGGRGHRFSVVSELSSDLPPGGTDRGSIVSDIPPGSPPPPFSPRGLQAHVEETAAYGGDEKRRFAAERQQQQQQQYAQGTEAQQAQQYQQQEPYQQYQAQQQQQRQQQQQQLPILQPYRYNPADFVAQR